MKLTHDQIQAYARNAGFSGDSLTTIIAIAYAESGGDTTATNTSGNSAGIDRGIVQINSFYHNEVSDACAFDPACAFKAAYAISNNGTSFAPWATYTNGNYKTFMGATSGGTSTITGLTLPALPDMLNPLTQWIAALQPAIAWLADPVRVIKMVTGIVLITLAIILLTVPGTEDKIMSFVKNPTGGTHATTT